MLWTPGAEPRRLPDGSIQPGLDDHAPWQNALRGRARGVELVVRRDAPNGLSGWAGYAYGRLQYTEVTTGQRFSSDVDQRHTVSLYGHHRLSSRASVSAKFRHGSNYPIVGYIGQHSEPPRPPMFPEEPPPSYELTTHRNTLRLSAYVRLDLRADRTFSWNGNQWTLFVEVANALNRRNVRNVPYSVDRLGRVTGPTDTLLPIVPSAGFVVEF